MNISDSFCYHCGLPCGRSSVNTKGHDFCCYGCVLAYGITGESGEEGEALWLLARLGVAFFFAMNVVLLSVTDYLYPFDEDIKTGINYIKMGLATPVILLLGIPVLRNSLNSVSRLRPDLDTLIVIGTFSAFFISVISTLGSESDVYYDTAVMILVLVTLGKYLEANSKADASRLLERFLDLEPDEAVVIREGKELRIPVEEVVVGDTVKVLPGSGFPVDGVVAEGESTVDESMLTGESKPVYRGPGSDVFSGTTNIDGFLLVTALKVGEEKTVSRFARLVRDARILRPDIQRTADRISQIFIPVVIAISLSAFIFWLVKEDTDKALMVSLSVLLISCPCALGIATPMALWVSVGNAVANGVLIKSAAVLEKLSRTKLVFFDKTGTLTKKELEFGEAFAGQSSGTSNDELVSVAAAVEQGSEHPLGSSLINYARSKGYRIPDMEKFRSYPGLGVSAVVNGNNVFIGSVRLMEQNGLEMSDESVYKKRHELETGGLSATYCGWSGQVRGILGFSERVRDEAFQTIDDLKELNTRVTVLTGDGKYPAMALSEALGVEVRHSLTPEEKVAEIRRYNESGGISAMVGDGINDAPALNSADVGLAMGCGTDLTRESADISFLDDDLRKVPWVIGLSGLTVRTIKQNLFWAFIYNVLGLGLAVAGVLQPVVSALAMVLSSLFVMGNSLRIRRYKP